MRIENITDKRLKNLLDEELSHLRSRFINIFNRYFEGSDVQKAVDIDRRVLLTKYMILRSEMNSRGIKFFRATPLDREVYNRIFKASLWKLDVPALGDMVAIPNYVSICGEFIKSPVATEKIDIVIRTAKEHRNEVFEAKIGELVKEQTNKEPSFIYEPKGPDKSYIPLFDLVLKSHEETRKMKVVKILKATIPYKDLGMAAEITTWAGPKETVKAEVEDLRQICAWYDSSNPDIKSSYKLPHHRMSDKKAVWRAVSAAMAALMGARGGVQIPDADRKGVYNHLVGHYKQFDKEAPELKKYDKEELEKAFPIEKPEENNMIRIPVGPDCDVTATITIDKGQGISALYCGKIKKIRTYLFDKRVKAWTMASAKAWIKEHTEKIDKKLSEARQKDYDEETALIKENAKKAKYPHKFKAAKWTWPNGHPRCIHCGQEEMADNKPCEKSVAKFKIIKLDKKKQIVGGIVYEPNEVDTQGDYTDTAEIEKAMHRFMEKYATNAKRIRIDHKGKKYFFPILECFQPESDTVKGDQPLKKGSWWIQIKILNKEIWKKIEDGTLTGFSMGGRAKA